MVEVYKDRAEGGQGDTYKGVKMGRKVRRKARRWLGSQEVRK